MMEVDTMDLDPGLGGPTTSTAGTVTVTSKSRQKSCNACVAGKRKCDKKTPKCSRCEIRNVSCIYHRRPDPNDSPVETTPAPAPPNIGSVPVSLLPPPPVAGGSCSSSSPSILASVHSPPAQIRLPTHLASDGRHDICSGSNDGGDGLFSSVLDINLDGTPMLFGSQNLSLMPAGGRGSMNGASGTSASGSSAGSPDSALSSGSGGSVSTAMGFDDMLLDYSVLDFMPGLYDPEEPGDWFTQCSDMPDLSTPDMPGELHPRIPGIADNMVQCAAEQYRPWHVKDPHTKIGWLVRSIQDAPTIFARTRSNSFIHAHLYRVRAPRAATHVWTACSVYAARTPATEPWAMRVVMEGSANVMRSPEPATALDRVGRVHALMLYQMIKVFDGDVMLGSQAEREMPTLLRWLDELSRTRDALEGEMWLDLAAGKPRVPRSWEHWILIETIRRTVIMGYCFVGVFEILKGRTPPQQIFSPGHVFTVSRHLWEAETSANFFFAWREKPKHLIVNMHFACFVDEAKPEDIDDFGRMFLMLKCGSAETERFLGRACQAQDFY